ncbi:hypothetical protein GCM10027275_42700 [Rhabdobacter roseus]|uniref:Uncharacterized protein n=1 Tax=Rhabdobacter roseus TaxID=1655419 RepID=A0A840U331_9BACT|nr:hypothetical protein [Rhabdobacter roseus]MBB5286249.1 hypothetical protein [Rhabdobacter roseus]
MFSDLQPVLQYLETLSVKIARLEAEQIVSRNILGNLAARIHNVEYKEIESMQQRMEQTTKQALLPSIMEGIHALSEAEVRKQLGI